MHTLLQNQPLSVAMRNSNYTLVRPCKTQVGGWTLHDHAAGDWTRCSHRWDTSFKPAAFAAPVWSFCASPLSSVSSAPSGGSFLTLPTRLRIHLCLSSRELDGDMVGGGMVLTCIWGLSPLPFLGTYSTGPSCPLEQLAKPLNRAMPCQWRRCLWKAPTRKFVELSDSVAEKTIRNFLRVNAFNRSDQVQ